MSDTSLDEFIHICTTTFKQYGFKIENVEDKEVPWHLELVKNKKKYATFCLPENANEDNLRQNTILNLLSTAKQGNYRAVVICQSCTSEDKKEAEALGYCLLDVVVIQDFYEEMAHALEREYEDNFLFDPLGGAWPMHLG